MNSGDLESQEAFIASSFIEFHTQESPSGEWIPVSESEAREVFEGWLAEHDAALIEGLADEIRHKQHAESIRQMLREKARQRREEKP